MCASDEPDFIFVADDAWNASCARNSQRVRGAPFAARWVRRLERGPQVASGGGDALYGTRCASYKCLYLPLHMLEHSPRSFCHERFGGAARPSLTNLSRI